MKQPNRPAKTRALHTPLDLHRFPLTSQADATPNREAVRETAHPVTAPRQTKRRADRNNKGKANA
jgi:hypothetical protein